MYHRNSERIPPFMVPVVIRAVINRGGEQGAQHSQALQALFAHVPGLKVVMPSTPHDAKGLDERTVQGLVDVVARLAEAGKKVIVAGLDLDYLGRPFEPIPSLMVRAEYVTKSLAVCHRCGGAGMFTQRVIRSDELVVLGSEGAYEARCRRCYDPTEGQQARLDIDAG